MIEQKRAVLGQFGAGGSARNSPGFPTHVCFLDQAVEICRDNAGKRSLDDIGVRRRRLPTGTERLPHQGLKAIASKVLAEMTRKFGKALLIQKPFQLDTGEGIATHDLDRLSYFKGRPNLRIIPTNEETEL